MNINELREQWHRDAEQAHDWHEAAWHLMRELEVARNELASKSTENPNKVLVDQMAILAKERNDARAETREVRKSWQKDYNIADGRATTLELELGATRASLIFALETNKRLKAELDDARTECARAISEYNDLARRVSSLAPATELAEAMRLNSSLSQENVRLKAERDAALAKLERIEDIL